jgi:hypothetical protein
MRFTTCTNESVAVTDSTDRNAAQNEKGAGWSLLAASVRVALTCAATLVFVSSTSVFAQNAPLRPLGASLVSTGFLDDAETFVQYAAVRQLPGEDVRSVMRRARSALIQLGDVESSHLTIYATDRAIAKEAMTRLQRDGVRQVTIR